MIYLIQVNIYTAIMLLVYMLLLRNKPVYRLSRNYLIAAAVLPFLLPLIRLPEAVESKVQAVPLLQFRLPEVVIGAKSGGGAINWPMIAWIVYGLISAAIIVYHVWNVIRLQKVVNAHEKEARDGYVLISNSGYGPGSFGKYIFFPTDEVNEAILAHEQAHITLKHTRDILLLNLLQAVAWPSLLLGRIKKEIKEVHEFQADAMANEDKRSYAELLVSSVLNTRSLPEMHLFIIHPLKRRIMMLQKNGKASPMKTSLLLSSILMMLGCAVLFVQGCDKKDVSKPTATLNTKEISKAEYDKEANGMVKTGRKFTIEGYANGQVFEEVDSVRKVADVMPESPIDMVQFLVKNMHYPEYARKHNIEGRVMVKFVVGTDGSILNPQILRSPDTSVSRAALEVINKMPNWQPGRMADGRLVNVEMYLPIVFKLK